MNTDQHMSEDLILYALGELEPKQSAEVRAHLQDCAACRTALEDIYAGMSALALSASASAPPARSRARLLRSVAAEPTSRRIIMKRPWWSFVPAFAAVLLAVIGLLLWRENSTLRNRIDTLRSQVQGQQQSADKAEAILQTLTAPEAVRYTLVSTNAVPQPQGRAIYLRKRSALVFVANNLSPVQPGRTYELWLLPENGSKPIPAGTFKPDEKGNADVLLPTLPSEVAAKGFAITIENDGGSETPTMPIVMSGQ